MKKLILFLLVLFLVSTSTISAQETNKRGIHVLSENDFNNAAKILNADDESWSYVTLVIRQDERNTARWQRAFDELKSLRLIPIVRIATTNQGGIWSKPSPNKAKPWAQFLGGLNWPTHEKIVILFNEPNHSKEWGGSISPEEYAQISRVYWEQLKRIDPNFTVLPAALDAAAPNSRDTMESFTFYTKMFESDELIFTIFDGHNSHSYPNPGFSGKPTDTGKASIQGYASEINFLTNYHLRADSPVYITETGWKNNLLSEDTIKNYYQYAFNNVWNHSNIKAVTPFVINYPTYPFSEFSWIDKNGNLNNYFENVSI